MTEADFKRDIVRRLLKEGSYARRLEDKYAIGTLDLIIVTKKHMIYAEAKLIPRARVFPASVMQREQIRLFNAVGNPYARAIVVAYRDGHIGFGLPGEEWVIEDVVPWPPNDSWDPGALTHFFDDAVELM